jgi:hypothetical protein
MKKAVILALAMVVAMPAQAADDVGQKEGKPGTNVDMPFLMAPLIDGDGKLLGYAYISSRLTAVSDIFALAVREKLPFIQDAMVRDVNANSIAVPDDPEKVDIGQLESRMLNDVRKVMGPGKVKQIMVCSVQISELHPSLRAPNETSDEAVSGASSSKNPAKSRCET